MAAGSDTVCLETKVHVAASSYVEAFAQTERLQKTMLGDLGQSVNKRWCSNSQAEIMLLSLVSCTKVGTFESIAVTE